MPSTKEFVYDMQEVAYFRFTRDLYGGFSNFARFPIEIRFKDGTTFTAPTSENLYQAAKFSSDTEICRRILTAKTAKESKQLAYANLDQARLTEQQWMQERIPIMRWVLRQKLSQHEKDILNLFRQTHGKMIVEFSKRDAFWGAKPYDDNKLRGVNMLGRLWQELYNEASQNGALDGIAL